MLVKNKQCDNCRVKELIKKDVKLQFKKVFIFIAMSFCLAILIGICDVFGLPIGISMSVSFTAGLVSSDFLKRTLGDRS